ncbi:Major surface antigen 4 precursor [Anaplasma phagocytophilum]|uniref:Major surface antigen 4 n=1 Tax=Anaplasma phagocytophilum TaxID=948 RepID=A0AA45UU65_ANAPH|nr:Major surface antigen 4 precursor [Anaplasma phagocytophilum]SBO31034.1 Major surface antigen 4 precursor [Anaplasma phagocytophilum]SBO33616.1 Major surface antigen 4 precursor [Anaplasma phagocytophilum]SBO33701.1 Major surface antigen 4 precursor [Anaplasma phagocytophilum]SCV65825.1 Major surface antigen 4 precursor [Anaplasma phagocytophilum]
MQFANAVKISAPNIDGKVCVTKKKGSSSNKFGKYAGVTDNGSTNSKAEVAVCGAEGAHTTGGSETAETLKNFVSETLRGDGSKNWPTSEFKAGEPSSTTNDNANAVAKDLTKLTTEEKTIVAGLLAKTIEGGEVVEIRAVSSTSVMVNACYDLLSEGLGVVPYACVGSGMSFIGVVDGIHYTNHL